MNVITKTFLRELAVRNQGILSHYMFAFEKGSRNIDFRPIRSIFDQSIVFKGMSIIAVILLRLW